MNFATKRKELEQAVIDSYGKPTGEVVHVACLMHAFHALIMACINDPLERALVRDAHYKLMATVLADAAQQRSLSADQVNTVMDLSKELHEKMLAFVPE